MVPVGDKPTSARTASAACRVEVGERVAALIADGVLPKGDVLAVARVAGIQAAKRTPDLIPLCHQIALTSVEVDLEVDRSGGAVEVRTRVSAVDRTGVEMEALVAAGVAALTVYDMVKSVERGVRVTDLHLLEKTGGTRGDWAAD